MFFSTANLKRLPGQTIVFRAVSDAELANLFASQVFQSCPNSAEGKYFAETLEHATEWGRRLYGEVKFWIIAVELPQAKADKLIRWERLDGIGPARFAEIHELTNAVITVVK